MNDAPLFLFEDDEADNFLPLTWTRPVWALRCGILTLGEAIEAACGQRAAGFWVRPFLRAVVRERTQRPTNEAWEGDGMALLLNGRLLADEGLAEALPAAGEPRRFVATDGTLLGAWLPAALLRDGWQGAASEFRSETVEWPVVAWPWELIEHNGARITRQAAAWELGFQPHKLPGVHLLNRDAICIPESSTVQPGVVLDGSAGPIVLESGATVMANAVLQGPCYVGRDSSVKIGAKIYHDSTIGPVCKVGGEVEATILHGFSNKQHDGFLGHAYVGAWCNFGADSNNSDLKNNYRSVSVWLRGAMRDSGSLFVGLFMGDHSKTGINAMLNTGTVVGVSCNLFGAGLPPTVVPSFSWGGAAGLGEYRLAEALETAERVMARRQQPLSEAERALLGHIFHATAAERTPGAAPPAQGR